MDTTNGASSGNGSTNSSAEKSHPKLGWWHEMFLSKLHETRSVTAACKSVQIDRATAYNHRRDDPDFRVAWDQTIQTTIDDLEASAMKRAIDGTRRPLIHKGQIVYMADSDGKLILNERGQPIPLWDIQYETALTIFMLKANRGDKYLFDKGTDELDANNRARDIRLALEAIDRSLAERASTNGHASAN